MVNRQLLSHTSWPSSLSNKAPILQVNLQILSLCLSSNIFLSKCVYCTIHWCFHWLNHLHFIKFIIVTTTVFIILAIIIDSNFINYLISSSSIFNGLFEQNSGARSSFWALKLLISYVSALQGSSSSVTTALCWSFDMLAFEKQFMTVSWMYVTFPS